MRYMPFRAELSSSAVQSFSDIARIKGAVILREKIMRPVGDAEESRVNLQQAQGSKGIERAQLRGFFLIAEEENRVHFQQRHQTNAIDYARVVGLLFMAASAFISLYLISIVSDLSALVFQTASLLIANSVS